MASSSNDDDSQQKFALGFLFTLITLVVLFAIGVGLYKTGCTNCLFSSKKGTDPVTQAVPATAAGAEAAASDIPDGASIRVENGVVKFYFASGSADIATGAAEALAEVAKGVAAGKKAVISGYHDTTGDPAKNEELARGRAETVQAVLVGMGVPADKLVLQKPEVTAGTGSNAQARRVEVTLID